MYKRQGVVCYYTFSVKGFHENYAVFAPNSRSLQEQQEEKVFGLIPKEKQKELYRLIRYERPLGKKLSGFLKENRLLFAATDRSVLNLPAIGKSMTFQMVGLTTEGKRILKFDHDTGRRHSPIIDRMGEVYIVENKSVAAYLRQLQDMGEDVRAVSYTHLDVYKRQEWGIARLMFLPWRKTNISRTLTVISDFS